MVNELQRIVDALASRLDRAVAVDDRQLRLLAYSRHVGQIDDVRKASILAKEAPDNARRYVMGLGIAEAEGGVRIPGREDLGMESRVVAPIRAQGKLLGYLWLIDSDQTFADADLGVLAATAETVGSVLYREMLITELEVGRERELLRDLLADDAELRSHAAHQLVEGDLFVAKAPVAVLVVRPATLTGEDVDEPSRMAMGAALDQIRHSLSPRHRLHLVRPDHGLLLVATTDAALPADGVTGLGEQLHQVACEALARVGSDELAVGIGDTQTSLTDAVVSYRQALRAVRVTRIIRTFGPIAAWSRLGIYRLLSQIPVDEVVSDVVNPGLARLLAADRGDSLVETLETYLDLAGDAKATAAALNLHRASLYYRLHKIEEIAGADLRNGEDRLAMHLGLKLARIAGLHPHDRSPARPSIAREA